MEFTNTYFEDEVRDGFYIPGIMKRAWAAQLEVLKDLDEVCRKHNIRWFAAAGSILGAVRHGGYIPWDDDLDICMLRDDYIRFEALVEKKELPANCSLLSNKNEDEWENELIRVVNERQVNFSPEHLRKYHDFPYVVGVDITILDYLSTDSEEENYRKQIAKIVRDVANNLTEENQNFPEMQELVTSVEKLCSVTLNRKKSLRKQMYALLDEIYSLYSVKDAIEVTDMYSWINGNSHVYKKDYFAKTIYLPFETTEIAVPGEYEAMLRKWYGDYMRIVRNTAAHDYPFFKSQKQKVQAVMGRDISDYPFTGVASRDAKHGRNHSFKGILRRALEEMQRYHQVLMNLEMLDMELLQSLQQWAIDIGTLIEKCKGEGHPTIHFLEVYCEDIYVLSQEDTEESRNKLEETLNAILESAEMDILQRRTVVFLPYKANQWDYLQSIWIAAMEDENCDVYVIPIPYFYREFDGTFRDMQYEGNQFPENVIITPYDQYDFALNYPDTIYIQNPYDECNPIISTHSFFYSTNLRKFTEQLVYIPPFVLEEFGKVNEIEYHNMQYYCTMPGVVNADKVILQSENMKQMYVEKLTEWAGEDTRGIWEEKIQGTGAPKNELEPESMTLPEGWKSYVLKEDGSRKKIVLYYVALSSFMQYKEQVIEKMKWVFQIFSEQKEDVTVLWKFPSLISATLEQMEPELYQTCCKMRQEYLDQGIGILDETRDEALSEAICSAYYGDGSPLAQACRSRKKPVMIQSYNIK